MGSKEISWTHGSGSEDEAVIRLVVNIPFFDKGFIHRFVVLFLSGFEPTVSSHVVWISFNLIGTRPLRLYLSLLDPEPSHIRIFELSTGRHSSGIGLPVED